MLTFITPGNKSYEYVIYIISRLLIVMVYLLYFSFKNKEDGRITKIIIFFIIISNMLLIYENIYKWKSDTFDLKK